MKRTLIVHIGIHKTGSTSFQKFCYLNKALLAEHDGCDYLSISSNHSYPLFTDNPFSYHMLQRKGIVSDESISEEKNRIEECIVNHLSHSTLPVTIISGEDLSLFTNEEASSFVKFFEKHFTEIKVFFIARGLYPWILSAAQQALKKGATLADVKAFTPVPSYKKRLAPWIGSLGKENVFAIKYEDCIGGRVSYAHYLLRKMGVKLKVAAPYREPDRANASMTLEASYLLSSLNQKTPLFLNGKLNPNRQKNCKWVHGIPGRKFAMPLDVIKRAVQEAREDADWVSEQFSIHILNDTILSDGSEDCSTVIFSSESAAMIAKELESIQG